MNGRAATSGDHRIPRRFDDRDADLAPLAPIALVLGLGMEGSAVVAAGRIPSWASDYGVMVVAASVIYLVIATWLVFWGVGRLRNRSGDT